MLCADAPLLSVNDHLVEPPDVWTSRSPSRRADDVPRVVTTADGEVWAIGSELVTVRALSVLAADGVHRPAPTVAEMHPAVSDPVARLRAMDDDGVLVHTLLPHVAGFAGERLRFVGDAAGWAAAARAYNDFLLESFCATDPLRLAGVAVVPLATVDDAVAELERAATLGARAVSFPHDLASLGLPTLYEGAWSPFFAAAAVAGLPVFVHVGSSGAPPSIQGMATPGALLVSSGLDVATALVDFVFSSTLTDHPTLRLVLLEGGAAILPFVGERIDFFRTRRRAAAWDPPDDARTGSEILRDQVYASFIDDPVGVALRDRTGLANLLWQSDFPHADSGWPHSRDHLVALLADVPDDDAAAIAGGNTRVLLGL
jgi:predicted TIM-barrel fold metal-dependent hydrolase